MFPYSGAATCLATEAVAEVDLARLADLSEACSYVQQVEDGFHYHVQASCVTCTVPRLFLYR